VLIIKEALRWSKGQLEKAGIEQSERESLMLLSALLRSDRAYLMAHPEEAISDEVFRRFQRWVRRRSKREPLAYITRSRWFYGMEFHIMKGVLIPRPETETLVEVFLRWQQAQQWDEMPVLADVGTGSGCIVITCLQNAPDWHGIGIDSSSGALQVARMNRKRHHLSHRLQLIQAEWLDELPDASVHAVLSNPPYVRRDEWQQLLPEIRDWEPESALIADAGDGLSVYRVLALQSKRVLKPGGLLALEIGGTQAEAVSRILHHAGWQDLCVEVDLQQWPRVVWSQR
jgi:release factor glutamine methyltransferase